MSFLERQLEDSARLSRIKFYLYVGLAVVALAEIVVPIFFQSDHSHFWFERFPGWGSICGLVSCLVIIIFSKLLGKVWLTRHEDYYDS